MSMQALFQKAAPLSKEQHGDAFLETGKGYDFAKNLSFVPAFVTEFPDLVSDYTLAFLQKGEKVGTVALLGLKEKENLYIKADGSWAAAYVPAMLRQYPFAAMVGDDRRILCIAEDCPGLNKSGKGTALFGEDGEISNFVARAQKLVSGFADGGLKSEAFCLRLKELGLLSPMKAVLKSDKGEERRISGIYVVKREALDRLSAYTLKELQSNGMLELIYLHLLSLRNLRGLAARVSSKEAAKINETDVPEDKADDDVTGEDNIFRSRFRN
jgi:hypothetical protein